MARTDSLVPTSRLGAALRPAVVPPRLPGPGGDAQTWRAGGPGPPPRAPDPDEPAVPWGGGEPPGPGLGSSAVADDPPTEPVRVLEPRPAPSGPLRRFVPAGWRGA